VSQLTAISLMDAQATPVAHNFVPNGRDEKGTFWLVDRSQSNAIGYWKISIEFKEPPPASAGVSSKDRSFRIRVGLHEPVMETLSNSTSTGVIPAPQVAYIPRAFSEFIIPERATVVDRASIRKMMTLLLDNGQMAAVVQNLDRPY